MELPDWPDPFESKASYGLVATLLASSQLLGILFGFVPILGSFMEISTGIYTMFLAMHLIGLHFRKHPQLLENLYL